MRHRGTGHHIFETFDADKNSDLDLDEFITLYEEYFLCVIYLFIFIFYVCMYVSV